MSVAESDTLATTLTGYSAQVEIELFVNGQRFSVAQCSREFLIFDKPITLPGTEGELGLTIGGKPRRWKIRLMPNPAPSQLIRTTIETGNP